MSGTPIYDEVSQLAKDARAHGELIGRIAERKEILELLAGISKKPTAHLKKAIELIEGRN